MPDRAMVGDGDVIWEPGPEARQTSRIGAYLDWLAAERGLNFETYQDLWQWSVDDLDGFWRSIWDYFGVRSTTPVTDVLAHRTMPFAKWFPGTHVNYAAEIVRHLEDRLDEVAIVGISQTRAPVEWSNATLLDQVARLRRGLLRLGVEAGDRVVAYLPNLPETAAAYLACASLGAVWASAAPELGPQAVIDRFGQLEPTVLLAIDGYRYGDKAVDLRARVAQIRSALPSLRHVVGLAYLGDGLPDAQSWADLAADLPPDAASVESLEMDALPVRFDHPLCVLFSSGTTGLPKAIVHGHGGLILETYKNHVLSWDLGPGDRLMWFSTTAWMIWNALVATLMTGASIVCIDGNPMHPDVNALWRIAETARPTMLGLGPAYVMSCAKQGLKPAADFDLSSIRMLGAAGSPMPAEGFVWLDGQFGRRAPLNIGSGGTDVCTGIVQGCPIVPVYAGEMSAKCLGVAVYAFDEAGHPVVDELGELVITEPMPSMPVGFWGDDDGERYRAAYFEQYPGVMRFGDWVRFRERGSSVITGRSDATLNRGGVRIGTAEIYRVVELHVDVDDSLVVHLEAADGGIGELVLFVAAPHRDLDDAFIDELRGMIRDALSPRHVPDTVVPVPAVPRSLTGKKLELPVKRILGGADPTTVVSREAMAEPDALDAFLEIVERRRR
jgi:acetoacetyl-CoA synthetase